MPCKVTACTECCDLPQRAPWPRFPAMLKVSTVSMRAAGHVVLKNRGQAADERCAISTVRLISLPPTNVYKGVFRNSCLLLSELVEAISRHVAVKHTEWSGKCVLAIHIFAESHSRRLNVFEVPVPGEGVSCFSLTPMPGSPGKNDTHAPAPTCVPPT